MKEDNDLTEFEDDSDVYEMFTMLYNRYVSGENAKVLYDITLEQCLYACLVEDVFACTSLDYNGICHLSDKHRNDTGIIFSYGRYDFIHFERNMSWEIPKGYFKEEIDTSIQPNPNDFGNDTEKVEDGTIDTPIVPSNETNN